MLRKVREEGVEIVLHKNKRRDKKHSEDESGCCDRLNLIVGYHTYPMKLLAGRVAMVL